MRKKSIFPLIKSFFSREMKNIDHDILSINLQRSKYIGSIFLLLMVLLIVLDIDNKTSGLWESNSGYVKLFYGHLVFLVGMSAFLIILHVMGDYLSRLKNLDILITLFIIFSFANMTITSAYIDQFIHEEISVYIIGCFLIAITFYLKPIRGLVIYSLSYILFMVLLTGSQPDFDTLRGHYINGSAATVISYLFSALLYKLKAREIIQEKYLEELVTARTQELQLSNQMLENEIENHRKTLVELRHAHGKLVEMASIVQNSDDAIIGMSLDWNITSWNLGAQRVYGYAENEMIGQTIYCLIPEHKRNDFKNILAMFPECSLDGDESISLTKSGEVLRVSAALSTIRNKDEIVGASIIVRDITVQKNLEKEMSKLQKYNLIGALAASISHEVRNPMTTVKGFLQMLSQKEDSKQNKEYFELMVSEIDRANGIINEFLSISRSKAVSSEDHKLNQIIEQMIPLIEANAIESDVMLHVELADTPYVRVDDKEIRQVILNMVRNGVEAMTLCPKKLLTIRTYVENENVVLAVSDSGAGIPPEIIEKLGTPFFTTKDNGTGLGLAVCYGIIERHGGVIEVITNSEGTTFFIKLKTNLSSHNMCSLKIS